MYGHGKKFEIGSNCYSNRWIKPFAQNVLIKVDFLLQWSFCEVFYIMYKMQHTQLSQQTNLLLEIIRNI